MPTATAQAEHWDWLPAGPLCYVYADYMGSQSNGGAALLSAIIAQNYKYVFSGRSRVE